MKTKPKQFQTIVTAGSIEERDMRINELTGRGFEVARYFEHAKECSSCRTGLVSGRKLINHPKDNGYLRQTYGAVMRRKCRE